MCTELMGQTVKSIILAQTTIPQPTGKKKIKKWIMATLLDRMERTSRYSGLEARVPLADHRILEYVWNVPWEMKCPDGLVKGLLRNAGRGRLPDEVLFRRKSPYPKTYHPEYEKRHRVKLI